MADEVVQGKFRADLYYRLNVLKIDIPPLRQRPQDISYCAQHFLQRFNQRYPSRRRRLLPETLAALAEYRWPGNVRELQNTMERAFYTSKEEWITPSDLSLPQAKREPIVQSAPLTATVSFSAAEIAERQACITALEQTHGHADEAAAIVGVSRATFYRLCHHYGLKPKRYRRHY